MLNLLSETVPLSQIISNFYLVNLRRSKKNPVFFINLICILKMFFSRMVLEDAYDGVYQLAHNPLLALAFSGTYESDL